MPSVVDKPRQSIPIESSGEITPSSEIPSTDASTRPRFESAILPGTYLYEEWLDLLREGTITYEEFIDWTTPLSYGTLFESLLEALHAIVSGLMGVASGKRP